MNTRKLWLIRNGLIALLLLIFWNTIIVKPLRILVVFFHEAFHAVAAFITGGGIHSIEVTYFEAGTTALYGGWPVLVFSAGYVGTAFLGSILLVSGRNYPLKRVFYLVLGVWILLTTILLVKNPFGWAYGLVAGFFFLILFFKEFQFSVYVTDLLGVMCILYTFYDFTDFLIRDRRNDAIILQERTGIPYLTIVLAWVAFSFIIIALALFLTIRKLPVQPDTKGLRLSDFSLFIRRKQMYQSANKSNKKQSRWTIIIYFSVLGIVILLGLWASRFVLFQPWTAREWVAAVAVEKKIYTFGGRDRLGQTFDEVLQIDPGRLKIRTVGRLPSPRFGMSTAILGDKIYVFGGFDGKECIDDILMMDSLGPPLTEVGQLNSPRAFGGVAVFSGKIYYLGGWDGSKPLDEIIEFDPGSERTRIAGRLPTPREFITTASIGDRIYIIGGSDDRGRYLDEILAIDAETLTVIERGMLSVEIKRSSAVILDGKIFLMGGWEGRKSEKVFVITPSITGIEVQDFPNLPRGFSDIALVTMEGFLYLIGDCHERFQRQINVLRIDPDSGDAVSLKFRSFLFW